MWEVNVFNILLDLTIIFLDHTIIFLCHGSPRIITHTHTGVKILQKKEMLRMIWKKRVCAGGDVVAVWRVFKRTDIQQSTFMPGPNKKAKEINQTITMYSTVLNLENTRFAATPLFS